jgi:alpha-pyrone synthase
MTLAVLGLGTALPTTTLSQAEAVAVARAICCGTDAEAQIVPTLYRQTAIDRRHLCIGRDVIDDVLGGTARSDSPFLPARSGGAGPTTAERMTEYVRNAGPLALAAARRALDESGVPPREMTHLVTVSCTGFHAPGVDFELIRDLGLPPTVERTHVGFMGCHGALNGLRVARAYADAQPAARVLLCAVELCSLHFHYGWDPKKLVANALFADGAAALVGGGAGNGGAWRAAASGSCLFPDSAHAMTWHVGDRGFTMTLSTKVPDLIARNLRPWLEGWLRGHGLGVADVPSWAVHPGGPRVLTAVEEALGLRPEVTTASREVFAECGNMSSPTVLFILDRLRRRQAPRPCVALGFGPGLVAEAALFV